MSACTCPCLTCGTSDVLTTLRAEVQALMEEAWADNARHFKADELGAEMRALGRGRMAQTVLDLIDKHAREGQ